MSQFIVEEESGTCCPRSSGHQGYYAGQFTEPLPRAELDLWFRWGAA